MDEECTMQFCNKKAVWVLYSAPSRCSRESFYCNTCKNYQLKKNKENWSTCKKKQK